jgi:hypothetical protein
MPSDGIETKIKKSCALVPHSEETSIISSYIHNRRIPASENYDITMCNKAVDLGTGGALTEAP